MKSVFLLAAAGLVAAQNLEGEPPCATPCLLSAISAVCTPASDQACACASQPAIGNFAVGCLLSSCTDAADLLQAQAAATSICEEFSRTAGGASATPTSTSTANATGASGTNSSTATGTITSSASLSRATGATASSGTSTSSSSSSSSTTSSSSRSSTSSTSTGTASTASAASSSTAGAAIVQGSTAFSAGLLGMLLAGVAAL